MEFTKLQAHGNDFLIVDSGALPDAADLSALATSLCDRHFGAGADGLVVTGRSDVPTHEWWSRIFNADGGEAEVSGNGTRCLAAWLDATGAWPPDREYVRVGTVAGVKVVRRAGDGTYEAEMGRPILSSAEIPMLVDPPLERVVGFPLEVAGEHLDVTSVSMGNPHCSVFVDALSDVDVAGIGAAIERHEAFPARVNVEFVEVTAHDRIRVRFWERGVGVTLSSGTGSCAATVSAVLTGRCGRVVAVETDAGSLRVVWSDEDDIVRLTGRAEIVYTGKWRRAT
jgi:diaminopimelate epimerase